MDTFFALPWKAGPALALALFGLALTAHGILGMPNPTRQHVDLVRWIQGFRRMIVGLAIALGAGLQEVRESTSYLLTLDREARRSSRLRSQASLR